MKSGAPWKLRGRRPEADEIARPVSRRSRRSVSEWLNSVIEAADDEDVERSPPRDSDREPPKRWRQGFRYESRHKERAAEANRRSRDREEDEEAPPRRGGPYREEQSRAGDDRPRRD